ncbi:MAG: AAA family ATPase [Syntrophothermus sp.]
MGLKDLKPNKVQVLLEQYIHTLIGVRKTGKSTLFRDLVNLKYNGDMSKGLMFAFEKGYQALDGIYPVDINKWAEYEEYVNELISDRDELPYRLICIDTIDIMVSIAEKEAIRFFNTKVEPSKRAKTINEAGGGYGRGKAYSKQIIRDSLDRLIKAGYGIVLIGHSKEKTIKEKDGTEYMQLSCSLTNDYADVFMDMADIITFFTVEKEISDKQVKSSKIYMNFRSDGTIDCGGRFKGLPDKIEYGAENYMKVFENAVLSSMLDKPKDLNSIKKEQEQKFESDAVNNIKEMLTLPQLIKEIKNIMKEKLISNEIDNAFILNVLSSHGFNTPDDINEITIAEKILEEFKLPAVA